MTTLTAANRSEFLNLALQAALEAGDRIDALRRKGGVDISFKSEKDVVTNADLQAEAIIIGHIKSRYPDHGLLTEESHPDPGNANPNESLWIIDPIDGTANYAYGLDHSAVSIAYAHAGRVQAAVVHCPFLKSTFTATLGGGAYCNGSSIKPRATTNLSQAILATGFPGWRTEVDTMIAQTRAVLSHCRDIRRFGAAAIDVCYVAGGKLDGYWESVKPWDIAAGGLIAREAGARTGHLAAQSRATTSTWPSDWNGENFIVAAPALFLELQNLLRAAD